MKLYLNHVDGQLVRIPQTSNTGQFINITQVIRNFVKKFQFLQNKWLTLFRKLYTFPAGILVVIHLRFAHSPWPQPIGDFCLKIAALFDDQIRAIFRQRIALISVEYGIDRKLCVALTNPGVLSAHSLFKFPGLIKTTRPKGRRVQSLVARYSAARVLGTNISFR
jgi:hypothetical protein